MRPYYVAIVGAGPSGYFAAASLLKFADASVAAGGPDVRVDMLEMLPTPWGLVRSGVAPDHPKIKSISRTFDLPSPSSATHVPVLPTVLLRSPWYAPMSSSL